MAACSRGRTRGFDWGGDRAHRVAPTPAIAVRLFCRSALVRDQPTERYTAALRSRTSALLQGGRRSVDGGSILPVGSSVGADPVRDKPTERYNAAWLSRTGCAPTDKPARQREGGPSKADAQRGPALSPLRFGRVAQRFEVPPVYPRRLSHNDAPRAFGLIPTRCCGRYQAILFGLLFSWASKRKVTRAAAAVRNARRVPQGLALRRRRHPGRKVTIRSQGSEWSAMRRLKSTSGPRRDDDSFRAARQ
jgi:hypothetical protein